MSAGRARWALLGCAAALLAVHGAVGWLSPLQGDDWRAAWPGLDRWLTARAELGDAWGYLLARWPVLHAIATPAAGAIAIAGVFTLSTRRLPDPRRGRWPDMLGLALVSCLLWIALPRAGAMWFHRPYAAAQIYGAALAVWFLVPFRCGWPLAGAGWPIAMFVLGLAVGATTRQIGLAALVGAAIAVVRTPGRRRWMVPGLAGVAISFVARAARWQGTDLVYVFAHPERSLTRMEPLFEAGGPLIVGIALLVIARQLLRSPDRATEAGWTAPVPDGGDSLWWLGGWLGLGLAAQLGPNAATQLPAAIALCAGALPYLMWLADRRFARWLLICLAAGVHGAAWTLALASYRELDAGFTGRMAAIARTPANQVATVAPYASVVPDTWSIGEDWTEAATRDRFALDRGLAGIDLAPPFRQLEPSPELHLALEVDGATDAQLAAARPPAVWARDLANARRQFTALVARLRSVAGRDVSARLRVIDGALAAAAPHPLLAAWSEGAAVVAPVVARSPLDPTSTETVAFPPGLSAELPDAHVVTAAGARPARCQAGSCRLKIDRAERVVLMLCGAARCLAVDAQVPHL